ncbi:probable amino acid ABC transporter, periplasmic component [Candidatus Moduliflexus flocculans]|uniref:Probable amino acid ABC transporter, periplasmic component n=1 Tax=Candidatus Moduliflexus flocculans TaxID=1499966 RepID=A0A081BSJ0_9BACT|nr:probable amino acid ABC transporter, periplasmic component [Candidatus Moduliflexus flocculans]
MMEKIWVICLLCQLLLALPASANEKIIALTNDYEPYYGEKLPDFGPIIKITRLVFQEVGYDFEVAFVPWARAVAEAEAGACDMLIGVWFNTGREDWEALSEPMLENEIGFYKRKGDPLVFTDYAALKAENAVVGTVRGYINPEGLTQSGITIEEVKEDRQNIEKLVNDRIRVAVVDRQLGAYLAQKLGKEQEIEWLATLQRIPLRNGFIKNAKGDWQKKMDDFNRGLAILKEKGVIEQILKEAQFDLQ